MKAERLTDPPSTVFLNQQQQKLPRTTTPPLLSPPPHFLSPLERGAPKPSKNLMANPGEPIADSILWFRLLYWHSGLAMWSVLPHHSRHDWEYQTQALSEVIYLLSTEPSPRPMFYISVNSFFIFIVFPVVFSFLSFQPYLSEWVMYISWCFCLTLPEGNDVPVFSYNGLCLHPLSLYSSYWCFVVDFFTVFSPLYPMFLSYWQKLFENESCCFGFSIACLCFLILFILMCIIFCLPVWLCIRVCAPCMYSAHRSCIRSSRTGATGGCEPPM